MSWFRSKDKEIADTLALIYSEIQEMKSTINDLFIGDDEEDDGAVATAEPTMSPAPDPMAMLNSISNLYVESVNRAGVVEGGYKNLITAILMKVGNIGVSKELQDVCLNKSFDLTFGENGDLFLNLKNTIQQELREQIEN